MKQITFFEDENKTLMCKVIYNKNFTHVGVLTDEIKNDFLAEYIEYMDKQLPEISEEIVIEDSKKPKTKKGK